MATDYPKENTIRFTPITGNSKKEHTLVISAVKNEMGQGLILYMDAPMKILTSQETRDLAEWFSRQIVPE